MKTNIIFTALLLTMCLLITGAGCQSTQMEVNQDTLKEYEKALQAAEENYAYLEHLNTINHLSEGSFKLAELEIVNQKLAIWELKYGQNAKNTPEIQKEGENLKKQQEQLKKDLDM